MVMVSLPYSHYVELARWALFAKGVNVREIKCGLGPHVFVASLYRMVFPGGLSSTSSFPGREVSQPWYRAPLYYLLQRLPVLRRASGVPVVIHQGQCLPDSWTVTVKKTLGGGGIPLGLGLGCSSGPLLLGLIVVFLPGVGAVRF